jgi:hypothetical protein
MNYRLTQIQSVVTLSDNRTDTYDIDITEPISRISIQLKGTNADSVPDGHPAKAITKIELVDGAQVLYSMSGEEAQATDFYDTGISPLNVVSYVSANIWCCTVNMNFGRWLWDTELAFDPRHFTSPQLKVTHKVADTAGSSTTSTTSTITIYAQCFDQKTINPKGFLLNKEIFSYTIGAQNTYEYLDIPKDFPIRRMMIQALYVGYETHQIVNEFKISEDNDKRIVYDVKVSDYLKLTCPQYGKYQETFVADITSSEVAHYTAVDYEYSIGHIGTVDANETVNLSAYPLGGRMYLVAETGAIEAMLSISGYAPHGCIPIWCGDQDEITDWYDVRKVGSLVMRLKAGSLGGTAIPKIVIQQYRPY